MNKCQYCDKQTEITYWNGFTCLCKECYKLFFGTLKTARKEKAELKQVVDVLN